MRQHNEAVRLGWFGHLERKNADVWVSIGLHTILLRWRGKIGQRKDNLGRMVEEGCIAWLAA